jgi:hypothetical protein
VRDGQLELTRAATSDPDATVDTDPETFRALVLGEEALEDAERFRRVGRVATTVLIGLLVLATAVGMFFQYDALLSAWLTRFLPSFSQGL